MYADRQNLWWGQCEARRPSSTELNSNKLTTISHLLTGLHWSGLQVWSGTDQAQTKMRKTNNMSFCLALLFTYISLLIKSQHSSSPSWFFSPPRPPPPLFLSSFPSPCFLIPVHKTHQKFSLELGNEADLWPRLDDFHTCACAGIHAVVSGCECVCVCLQLAADSDMTNEGSGQK